MTRRRFGIGLAALCVLGVTAPAGGADAPASQPAWETYRVLVERNIFSRSRARRLPFRAPLAPQATPRPEALVVLTGIVLQGDERVAFLEDTMTGATVKVRAGDQVAAGRLKNITLDYVEYEIGGRTEKIRIGRSLRRAPPASMPARAPYAAASRPTKAPAAAVSAPPTTGKSSAEAILERLRQRRQKELGE